MSQAWATYLFATKKIYAGPFFNYDLPPWPSGNNAVPSMELLAFCLLHHSASCMLALAYFFGGAHAIAHVILPFWGSRLKVSP